jgi:hypothetical protein
MNERIRALAVEAGLIVNEWDGFNRRQLGVAEQRFAELIVRECINVAADHDALDIYEEIREHFGIEQ